MDPPVPIIEPAHHADPDGVRCPHREVYPLDTLHTQRMSPHFAVGPVIGALTQQVHVQISQLQRKAIRVFHIRCGAVEPRQMQPVGKGLLLGEEQFIEPVVMDARHIKDLAVRYPDQFHLGGIGAEYPRHHAGTFLAGLMHTQQGKWRTVHAVDDGIDFRFRQDGLHAQTP